MGKRAFERRTRGNWEQRLIPRGSLSVRQAAARIKTAGIELSQTGVAAAIRRKEIPAKKIRTGLKGPKHVQAVRAVDVDAFIQNRLERKKNFWNIRAAAFELGINSRTLEQFCITRKMGTRIRRGEILLSQREFGIAKRATDSYKWLKKYYVSATELATALGVARQTLFSAAARNVLPFRRANTYHLLFEGKTTRGPQYFFPRYILENLEEWRKKVLLVEKHSKRAQTLKKAGKVLGPIMIAKIRELWRRHKTPPSKMKEVFPKLHDIPVSTVRKVLEADGVSRKEINEREEAF